MVVSLIKLQKFVRCHLLQKQWKQINIIYFSTFIVSPDNNQISFIPRHVKPNKIKQFYVQNPCTHPFVEAVTKLGIEHDLIVGAVMRNSCLINYNTSTAFSCIGMLQKLGFTNNSIVSMMQEYPDMLSYNGEEIFTKLETWKNCHYGEKFIFRLFTIHPVVICVENNELKKRLYNFKHHMDASIGRVCRWLINSPDILFQAWVLFDYKMNYLMIRMKVTEKQICESKVLSYSILHIKTRHTFLEKSGTYITPNPKDKGFSPHKNPVLSLIMDTNDYEFACNVSKMSIEEYEVYKNLMIKVAEMDETETFEDIDSDDEKEDDEKSANDNEPYSESLDENKKRILPYRYFSKYR